MTLTGLAYLYCKEGCRGRPIGSRQSRKLFLRELRFGNGRFKSIRSLLKRMGWREERPLTYRQLKLIYARLDDYK